MFYQGTDGVECAVVDPSTSVVTALRSRGQSVGIGMAIFTKFKFWFPACSFNLGNVASIGITRSLVDNTDLENSLIARFDCINPGETSGVDADFLVLNYIYF